VLLVAPGEIAVVDGTLAEPATVSLDWISGESDERALGEGDVVVAGAINRGRSALRMVARWGFDRSPLESLLGRGDAGGDARAASAFWDRVSRVYVVAVLAAAGVALAGWWIATGDVVRALEVATAVLVVTCPCGIGIATPLAYELVTSALRRRGLFVRRERALDRAAEIGRVAFDKTGTLTTGRLELAGEHALDALGGADRAALADLVARSAHPKSEAVRRAMGGAVPMREGVRVIEEPGRGLRAEIDGARYRLGSAAYVGLAAGAASGDLFFARDEELLLALETREVLRSDASAELHALASEGYELAILSGDAAPRVRALADRLGLGDVPALSECAPEDKARWIDEHESRPTLFVGDGINDGLAADRAYVSGTPAIDRPFLPARSDFFFVTPGLAPIRALLDGGRALRRVARRNLGLAVAYNAVAVSLAAAGMMRPWLAAILMPASSLAVIAATTWSLRESRWADDRRTQWKS
jgi:Cu2+-exporting ATPase